MDFDKPSLNLWLSNLRIGSHSQPLRVSAADLSICTVRPTVFARTGIGTGLQLVSPASRFFGRRCIRFGSTGVRTRPSLAQTRSAAPFHPVVCDLFSSTDGSTRLTLRFASTVWRQPWAVPPPPCPSSPSTTTRLTSRHGSARLRVFPTLRTSAPERLLLATAVDYVGVESKSVIQILEPKLKRSMTHHRESKGFWSLRARKRRRNKVAEFLFPDQISASRQRAKDPIGLPSAFYYRDGIILNFISICLASLDWLEDRDKFFADDSVHRFKLKFWFRLWSMLLVCTTYPFQWGQKFYEAAYSFFTQVFTCFTTVRMWIRLLSYYVLVKTSLLFSEKQRSPLAFLKSASLRMFLGKKCNGSLVFDLIYHGGISSNLDSPMWFYLCVIWTVCGFVVLGVSSGIACGADLLLARSFMTTPLTQIWFSSTRCRTLLGVSIFIKPISFTFIISYRLLLLFLSVRWSYPYLLLVSLFL